MQVKINDIMSQAFNLVASVLQSMSNKQRAFYFGVLNSAAQKKLRAKAKRSAPSDSFGEVIDSVNKVKSYAAWHTPYLRKEHGKKKLIY